MKLRQLGSTDLFASEIALGTAELGLDYGIPAHGQHFRPVEGDAIRLLHEALDLGINFVDTARVYGNSEAIIGKGLIHRRADYILATKLVPLAACDLGNPILGSRIRQSIETSLRTLKTDYIDLLLVHSASLEVIRRSSELLEALRKMQRKGYVRYVGASVYEEAGGEALERGGFDCLQIAYSALDRAAEETILPSAQKKGIGIVARSVLLKGALTSRRGDLPEELSELKAAADSLEQLATAAGMLLPEMAFRYILSSDVIALCGTAHSKELHSAVEAANHGPLDPSLMEEIRKINVSDRRLLNPGNWPIL